MSDVNTIAISVILPTYNVEKWIAESVRSACEQDFPHDKYEIILVDDGTPDKSVSVALEVLNESDVKYRIIHQENQGLASARNTGIRNAEGEYVAFLDTDDIYAKEHLRYLYDAVIATKGKISFTGFERTSEENRWGTCDNSGGKFQVLPRLDVLNYFLVNRNIGCWSMLINREFLLKYDLLFNPKVRFIEDGEFMWRAFSYPPESVFVEGQTYKYLIRNNSIMRSQNMQRNLESDKLIVEMFEKLKELQNGFDYDMAYARHIIACLHSFAIAADYNEFIKYRGHLYSELVSKKLSSFPELKIRLLNSVLKFAPKLFYALFHKTQST